MNLILIANLVLGALVLGMSSFIVYSLYHVIKNERAKKKYLPTMKVGDSVHFSTQQSIDCTVSNLNPTSDENMVEVTVLIHKSSLYPNQSK